MGNFVPAILSGGQGTRLWPISRSNIPKQFCNLWQPTLFHRTHQRLSEVGQPWVVTHVDLKNLTQDALGSESQILAEPIARNTAPAIALLLRVLEMRGESSSTVGVFPADHNIENTGLFGKVVQLAIEAAQTDRIVTIGIQPSFPSTGFGYIELTGEKVTEEKGLAAFSTNGFREKPNRETAESYIQSGKYVWNAGMFVFSARKGIDVFQAHMPELWSALSKLDEDLGNLGEIYESLEGESFDYGIMEKETETLCIPADFGWSDVGSWDQVTTSGDGSQKTIEVQASGNSIISDRKKSAAFIGVDNLTVVDSENALLVLKKGESQQVKSVFEKIKKDGPSELLSYENIDFRPWGSFQVLRDEEHYKSKIIRVNPGHQISYQSHAKRAEHWVIVKGSPEVVLNDEVHSLKVGESIYIPQGAKHRIRNSTQDVVEFVEVQVGTYFGEDDIVRYEDDYSR